MSAVLADQELDSIIEGMQALLGDGGLCLLDDIQGVWGAQAQRINVAQWLQAAVWVHAIHQAICRKKGKEHFRAMETWSAADFREQELFPKHTVEKCRFSSTLNKACSLEDTIRNLKYTLICNINMQ